MKQVTMLQLRKQAQTILRSVAKGERFVLSHRGKPVAMLQPLPEAAPVQENDPFLTIGARATPSPKGPTRHKDIDKILYGNS